jgi:predicted lipoprotein with Yx(FWY)xxD motif
MRKAFALVLVAAGVTAAGLTAVAVAGGESADAKPATLTLRKSQHGPILFDGRGRALYSFTRDARGKPSRCYGDCASAWPVYYAPKGGLKAGKGVQQSLLKTTKRRDGRLQVTYNGWPLYYYAHEKVGEVKCHNVRTHGGLWLVMRASGKAAP